jgi:diguanylate cyclase (GGDEF)-like protein
VENNEFINLIKGISEDIIEDLKNKDIPPYPRYYQEAFLEKLKRLDDPKIKSFTKKYSYLFNSSEEHERHINDCFLLAKKGLLHYQSTNSNIENLSKENQIDKEAINIDYVKANVEEFIDALASYQSNIVDELERANQTIKEMKKEINRLEKETMLDPLTKLFNKNSFEMELSNILSYGMNRDLDCALLIIDIDDFKQINDNYGHIAGDKTLIYLAKLMKSSLRRGTMVFRIGGEEFAVILNRASRKEVIGTAKRLLSAISDSKLYYKGYQIDLTASIGVAFHEQADTVESFVNKADMAMYRAKKFGKNRVEIENASH